MFGSVLRREDTEAGDLDLLVDASRGMTMFDMAAMAWAVETLTALKVDSRTPDGLSPRVRSNVVGEAEAI